MYLQKRRKNTFLLILHGVAIGLLIAAAIRYVKKKCRAAERAVSACRESDSFAVTEPDSDI